MKSKFFLVVLCLMLAMTSFAAAEATAEAAEAVNPIAALIGTFAPMILIFALMYFLMIRPQRKKDKKVKEMLANLKVGDRVCTIGGIYGTITNIRDENTITLALGPQDVPVVFARWAIRNVEDITVENEAEVLA